MWTRSKCLAAVGYVVRYSFIGILSGTKNEQATSGTCRT